MSGFDDADFAEADGCSPQGYAAKRASRQSMMLGVDAPEVGRDDAEQGLSAVSSGEIRSPSTMKRTCDA